jgi:hypothetical protein
VANNDDAIDLMNEIESLKKKLAAAEGKALAAARAQTSAERDAKKAAEAAQTYREETDQMIERSAEHMKQAFAIGIGIWSLSRWAQDRIRQKDYARRMLHRHTSMIKILNDLVQGSKSNNRQMIEAALKDAETAVSVFKTNGERLISEEWETALVLCHKQSDEKLKRVRAVIDET